MPRSPNMTVYAIYEPEDGDEIYFYSIEQATIFAKTQAAYHHKPVEIIACQIGFPNKRSYVAALNGSKWCISREVFRTIPAVRRRESP